MSNLGLETSSEDALPPEARARAIRELWKRLRAEPRILAQGSVLVFVTATAALIEPWIFGRAVDLSLSARDAALLPRFAALFFGVTTVRVLATFGQAITFEKLSQRIIQRLRTDLFEHLQTLPLSTYDRTPVGKLVTRVTNDMGSIGEMFSMGFVTFFMNALYLGGIFVWLLVIDLRLGAIVLSVFPILFLALRYFSRRLRDAYALARSRLSSLNSFLAENLMGIRVLQLFGREAHQLERFHRVNARYGEAQFGTIRIYAFFQPTITFMQGLAMVLLLGFGSLRVAENAIPMGTLVALFSYVLMAFGPMRELVDKWIAFLSGMSSAERTFATLGWEREKSLQVASTPRIPPRLRGHIRFENVWFAYPGPNEERWVLRDLSFEIQPGEQVGVVGHTGAGKSTLIGLILRFYEPQKGRVLLDGKDLRDYDLQELRTAIGLIQQDVFLYSGSMIENVTLWRSTPELQAEAVALLESFGIGSFDRALDERGGNLSVGERQVIAFARAALQKPSFWILDEATANIDSDTEARLSDALFHASRGQTSILIAHRLATIRNADQILVLNQGRLVERGRHAELVQLGGLYSRLNRVQVSEFS